MRTRPHPRQPAAAQRGVVSLIVVGVLFLIVSLVAAYTNRNLVFEQRTSVNQYRATQALEAAEAGVEWALALLNAGHIDASCNPSDAPGATAFRERYLDIDAGSGVVTPRPRLDPATRAWPTCVFDGTGWVCACPEAGPAALAPPGGAGVFPAFRVTLVPLPTATPRPGLVRLQVNGCTRLDNGCLDFPATGVGGEGRASLDVVVMLRSALPAMPAAAVTVRGALDLQGAAFGAFNPDADSGGLALRTGGALQNDAALRLGGPAGTPQERDLLLLDTDPALDVGAVAAPGLRFFGGLFGATPETYRDQPATLVLDCSVLSCDAATLTQAVARNPGRIFWAINGAVTLDGAFGAASLGTPAQPVLLVVENDLRLVDVTVHGAVVLRGNPAVLTGANATVNGALVAENGLSAASDLNVVRDRGVLSALRWRHGSFVRVPGGWRDF